MRRWRWKMPATSTFAADVTQTVTAHVAGRVAQAFPRCRALILTGSAARQEATIARRPECVYWLSDLEFLVVVSDSENVGLTGEVLDELAATISKDLRSQGLHIKLELTPAPERYFTRIRPQLFGYELKRCGRQVFGDVNYLDRIPSFDWRSIPLDEAFRLVSNRLVELLELRLEQDQRPLAGQFYALTKTYLDLLTALSLAAGTYSPGYRARFQTRRQALDWATEQGCRLPESFPHNLEIAFQFKLDPDTDFEFLWRHESHELPAALALHGLRAFHDDLPKAALTIWRWLADRLSEHPGSAMDNPPRIYPFKARLRGWARLLLGVNPMERLAALPRAIRLFPAGSPRSLVYACAARLADPDCGSSDATRAWVRRYLPIPTREAGWQELAGTCVAIWRRHLRHSHA